jgi:hypothetical protein
VRVQEKMVSINISKATAEAVGVATAVGGNEVQSEGKCDIFDVCSIT